MKVRVLMLLGVAILATGCKKGPVTTMNAAAAEPVLQSNWQTYDRSQYGFKISAPALWTTRHPGNMPAIMGAGGGVSTTPDPDTPPTADLLAKGIVIALWPKTYRPIPGEAETRMTIKHVQSGGANIDDEAKDLKGDLMKIVEEKRVQLPAGPAHMFKTSTTTIGGDTVTEWVYLIVNDKRVYHVKFETTQAPESIANEIQPIMDTFRVTG